MKKLIAALVLGVSVLAATAMTSSEQSRATQGGDLMVDEALVNAHIDARLNQVLTGMVLRQAAARNAAQLSGLSVAGR